MPYIMRLLLICNLLYIWSFCTGIETLPADDCERKNDRYLCNNNKCISISLVCNKKNDCGDGSDEGPGCENSTLACASLECNHKCRMTPSGFPVCTCQSGYELQDNRTCIDIDECTIFGTCDQKCVNTVGSYKCICHDGYTLQNDMRTCKSDDGNATMIFSTISKIHGINLNAELYFIEPNLTRVYGIDMYGEYIYWSETLRIFHNDFNKIMKRRFGDEKEIILSVGLGDLWDLAVDWITGNIYFTDVNHSCIGVCNSNGSHCTVLINVDSNNLTALALFPNNGIMYWSNWKTFYTNDHEDKLYNGHIAMAGMDGRNSSLLVVEDIVCPIGVTLDYANNRLYWIDIQLDTIESIRLDGTDRRIILRLEYTNNKKPTHLAVFENRLYWNDKNHNQILSYNKFSGKDRKILVQTETEIPVNIRINHPAIRPKAENPCYSNPCSQLCLLNQNKGYTCACILENDLNSDNHTCRVVKEKPHLLIIAGGTFIDYYHEILGKPNMITKYTSHNITAATYDPISRMVLMADLFEAKILRYDPVTHRNETFISINGTIGGMAFDYIGNNLYLTNITRKTIEIYSMTTMKNMILYYEEVPYGITLAPEEGLMFVVFKINFNTYIIERMKMNGLGKWEPFLIGFGTPPSISYNKKEKKLFWNDEEHGVIKYIDLSGRNIEYIKIFRTKLKRPISLAVSGGNIFWMLRDRNFLYRKNIDYEFSHQFKYYNWSETDRIIISDGLSNTQIPHLIFLNGYVIPDENYGCRKNNGNCSHICLPTSVTSYTCACSHNMILSANNRTCIHQAACPPGEIKCNIHDICIKPQQRCDGIRDCPNGEDELIDCKNTGICEENQFTCNNSECISLKDRCNSHYDCADKSDEDGCNYGGESDDRNCDSNNLNNLTNVNVKASDECDEFKCSTGDYVLFVRMCDSISHTRLSKW